MKGTDIQNIGLPETLYDLAYVCITAQMWMASMDSFFPLTNASINILYILNR